MTRRRWPTGVSRALTLTILALTVACQDAPLPTPTELPSPGPSLVVLDAVTARQVGGDYAPIDITSRFSPDDTFYCAIQVVNAERDIELVSRWYFGDSLISETIYTTEAPGTGYVAFELSSQRPWPEGLYRVDILSAGVVLRSIEFRVARVHGLDRFNGLG